MADENVLRDQNHVAALLAQNASGDFRAAKMTDITDRILVDAIINSAGNDVEIVGPLESNGAIPVNVQDQHSRALDLEFIQTQNVTTLTGDVAVDDQTITVTSTTGFVAGVVVALVNPAGNFYFGKQVGAVAGSVVTLDTPVDTSFASADTTVLQATNEMAVDGSVTTQTFQIGPVGAGTGVELDITRIMGYMQDGTAMDDALFGGIAALTNGIVLRQNNGAITNIWNMKTNGELSLLCFDFAYTSKAPAGSFGARFRNTYAGQAKHGVTIRLDPGDTLELLVQDDLTDLESFRMIAQGHIVTD